MSRQKADDNRLLIVWSKNSIGWQAAAIHVVPDAGRASPPPPLPRTASPSALTAPAGLSGERAAVFTAFKQMQDPVFTGDRATLKAMPPASSSG